MLERSFSGETPSPDSISLPSVCSMELRLDKQRNKTLLRTLHAKSGTIFATASRSGDNVVLFNAMKD